MSEIILTKKVLLGYEHKFVKASYPIFFFQITEFDELKKKIIYVAEKIDREVNFNIDFSGHDGETNVDGITNSNQIFNFFDFEGLNDLKKLLKNACTSYHQEVFGQDSALVQKSWVNKLAPLKYIKKHAHMLDFGEHKFNHFSLHLTVKSHPENCTVYVPTSNSLHKNVRESRSFFQKNIEGCVTIFPGTLLHYTTPNISSENRYSLAMDIMNYDDSIIDMMPEMRAF